MRFRLLTGATGLLLALLAVVSHLVGLTYGANVPAPPPVRTGDLADLPAETRDRLRIVDGVPVLRLRGTPREIGRQHGRLLRRQIRFLTKEFYEAFCLKLVGEQGIREWTKQVLPHIPEHYREEIRGIAEGAGLPEETVLRVNCIIDRLQTVFCSTVVAAGDMTEGDAVYFGRNLDFIGRNVLHKSTVVLVFESEGKAPVAAVTWPGLVGILSGMNAHGVCGATMMIHHGTEARPGVPYMMMYRDALAGAKRMADVGDHVAKTKRTIPNNFTVVDATGAAEVLEYDATRLARRPARGGGVCSTNHFRSDELKDVGWRLGMRRYETLDLLLTGGRGLAGGRGGKRIGYEDVRQALRDTAVPYYLNVQSMIFLPTKRALHLSVGGKLPAAAQRFTKLDRAVLFGSE